MFRQIKWAYQRVVRGYDDRVYLGFDIYFLQVIPALYEFCLMELHDTASSDLNPVRFEIFTETIRLIKEWEKLSDEVLFGDESETKNLLTYIGQNAGYYWN